MTSLWVAFSITFILRTVRFHNFLEKLLFPKTTQVRCDVRKCGTFTRTVGRILQDLFLYCNIYMYHGNLQSFLHRHNIVFIVCYSYFYLKINMINGHTMYGSLKKVSQKWRRMEIWEQGVFKNPSKLI